MALEHRTSEVICQPPCVVTRGAVVSPNVDVGAGADPTIPVCVAVAPAESATL
jgi:hypothetical protein